MLTTPFSLRTATYVATNNICTGSSPVRSAISPLFDLSRPKPQPAVSGREVSCPIGQTRDRPPGG